MWHSAVGLLLGSPSGSHRDTPGSCDAPECEFDACLVLAPVAFGSTQGYCEVQEASGRVCATRTVVGKKHKKEANLLKEDEESINPNVCERVCLSFMSVRDKDK